MKNRFLKVAVLCLMGFFIGASIALYNAEDHSAVLSAIEPAAGRALSGADVGGPFTLTDHNGNTVTEQDYSGSYKLVFFGFTHCPDICPAGLKKMTTVIQALGEQGEAVQPLFITIDPGRDTPEVMKQYVEMYHPRLVGLTGSEEQLNEVKEAYKVYAAKAEDPALTEYTMNHSSYIFLMSPEGGLVEIFTTADTTADMVKTIMQAL